MAPTPLADTQPCLGFPGSVHGAAVLPALRTGISSHVGWRWKVSGTSCRLPEPPGQAPSAPALAALAVCLLVPVFLFLFLSPEAQSSFSTSKPPPPSFPASNAQTPTL